jgi:hypothetical protein
MRGACLRQGRVRVETGGGVAVAVAGQVVRGPHADMQEIIAQKKLNCAFLSSILTSTPAAITIHRQPKGAVQLGGVIF